MSDYPEHDKMAAVQPQAQAIGEFIETSGYQLAVDDDFFEGKFLTHAHKTTNQILADYFKIDLDKIEAEKRQMLDEVRALSKVVTVTCNHPCVGHADHTCDERTDWEPDDVNDSPKGWHLVESEDYCDPCFAVIQSHDRPSQSSEEL